MPAPESPVGYAVACSNYKPIDTFGPVQGRGERERERGQGAGTEKDQQRKGAAAAAA